MSGSETDSSGTRTVRRPRALVFSVESSRGLAVESFITPYQFSAIFCEDLGIPLQPYASTMSDLIQGQLDEAQNAAEIDITDAEVTEEDVLFFEDEPDDEDEDKVWDDADCRIIVNVRLSPFVPKAEW